MVDTLWFIDPFLEKLEERSCKIPDKLYFSGYRDLKKSHKKYVGAQVSLLSFYNMNLFLRMIFFRHFDCTKSEFKVFKFKESELKDRLDALAEVMLYPLLTNPRFQWFYKCVSDLYKSLEKIQ